MAIQIQMISIISSWIGEFEQHNRLILPFWWLDLVDQLMFHIDFPFTPILYIHVKLSIPYIGYMPI